MARRIRRNSRQVTSILYIVVGIIVLIDETFAIKLFAVLLIVLGALGLLS